MYSADFYKLTQMEQLLLKWFMEDIIRNNEKCKNCKYCNDSNTYHPWCAHQEECITNNFKNWRAN